MDFNDYVLQAYSRDLLEDARRTAERARCAPTPPIVRPALAAALARVRAVYRRWSSAVSAGSKPTTERAWSRSR
jgi:hypothetical protein